MKLSEIIFGRYFVFEIKSQKKVRDFRLYERAVDLCQKLNTGAYFSRSDERFDIQDRRHALKGGE